MDRTWVQGVVKNGQVVLEAPLGVPDGTIMTVTDYDPDDDPRPTPSPFSSLTRDEMIEIDRLMIEQRMMTNAVKFELRLRRAGLSASQGYRRPPFQG